MSKHDDDDDVEEKPFVFRLTIDKVDNGYILEGENFHVVHEEDERDRLLADEKMLWSIMDFFGIYGSKHDPERIRIVRERKDE